MNDPKTPAPNPTFEMPRRKRVGKWVIGAAMLVLVTLVAAFALREFGMIRFPWDPTPSISPNVGGSIKQGTPGMTPEEVQAAMQAEADKARVRLKINARPVFERGDKAGSLLMVNSAENNYNMRYVIRLNDTDEVIYDSGLMEPNTYIDNDKLSKVLPQGEYEATADILTYELDDPDNPISRYTANLMITIES